MYFVTPFTNTLAIQPEVTYLKPLSSIIDKLLGMACKSAEGINSVIEQVVEHDHRMAWRN